MQTPTHRIAIRDHSSSLSGGAKDASATTEARVPAEVQPAVSFRNLRRPYWIDEQHGQRVRYEHTVQLRLRLDRPVVRHNCETILSWTIEGLAHKNMKMAVEVLGYTMKPMKKLTSATRSATTRPSGFWPF
eukprot:3105492-Prymnesium_polylepis.2